MFWYIIIGLFLCFYAFYLYTRRYANPYKLIHIFGKKGSGKSCLMVRQMLKHKKRGWNIYTDMQDCIIPGVHIIKTFDLAKFRPEYHSLVCLDEVGISFDNREFKSFPPGLRDFFKYQRKYKVKIYMNSQCVDYDKKVRDVTDSLVLQSSIMDCISLSRPVIRSFGLTESSAEADARIADTLRFASVFSWSFYWMPHYFEYFDSFAAPERRIIRSRQIPDEITKRKRFVRAAASDPLREDLNSAVNNTECNGENLE